jgi:hypothetical protein
MYLYNYRAFLVGWVPHNWDGPGLHLTSLKSRPWITLHTYEYVTKPLVLPRVWVTTVGISICDLNYWQLVHTACNYKLQPHWFIHSKNRCNCSKYKVFYVLRSRNSAYSDWLRTGRQRGRSSSPGEGKKFLFSKSSRPALRSTQPPTQSVSGTFSPEAKRQERESYHSPPNNAEVKKMWIYTPTPLYAFIA